MRAGQRVAICDQLEDPKQTKTIVKRGVTELVTPGISYSDKVLDHKSNNFLASVHFAKTNTGVSFLDVSTGEYLVAEGSIEYIDKLLQSFAPAEIVFQKKDKRLFEDSFGTSHYTYALEDWVFTYEFGNEILLKHFETKSLKGFGIDGYESGVIAAGAVLHYLAETQHKQLSHIAALSRIEEERYVWLDRFTIRNLELIRSPHENAKTLVDVIDDTISPMGSRMLKRWVALPLKDLQPIEERLNIVHHFISKEDDSQTIKRNLEQVGDLERLISRAAVGRINPREVVQLRHYSGAN